LLTPSLAGSRPNDERMGVWNVIQYDLQYIMSRMGRTSITVRELQQNLKRVLARVERGETV
jgi:hypothetical protein